MDFYRKCIRGTEKNLNFDNRVERLQEYLFTKNGVTNFRDFETSKGMFCNFLTIACVSSSIHFSKVQKMSFKSS